MENPAGFNDFLPDDYAWKSIDLLPQPSTTNTSNCRGLSVLVVDDTQKKVQVFVGIVSPIDENNADYLRLRL